MASDLLFYLAVLFLAVVSAAFLKLDLVLPLIVFLAIRKSGDKVYLTAFLAGLISDLVLGRALGVTAIFYLLTTFAVAVYKRRYQPGAISLAFFVIIFELGYGLLLRRVF